MGEITVRATPLPDPTKPIEQQDELILLAMLMFGEARSEKEPGMLAVGHVVRNRVLSGKFGGDTWRGVILRPWQFSCFNLNDINRQKLLDPLKWESNPLIWDACYVAARAVYDGLGSDPTGRATHYYVIGTPAPSWSVAFGPPTVKIGKHLFFRDPNAFKVSPAPDCAGGSDARAREL